MTNIINLTESKFSILKNIALCEQSSSDLAKKMNCSIPYAHQQLVLLEAQGFVKKKVIRRNEIGKPKTNYKLSQDLANIVLLREGFASQFKINKDDEVITYLQILSIIPTNDYYILSKFYWENIKWINKLLSLSFISFDDEKFEFFGIAKESDCNELRNQISHLKINDRNGKLKVISCWINSIEECEKGIRGKDNYYLSHVARARVLFDEDKIIEKLKEMI